MLKKLKTSLLFKLTLLSFVAFFLLYILSYAFLNNFLQANIAEEELSALMIQFNQIWINLIAVFVIIFLFTFFILRFLVFKVSDEIEEINNFLEEINKKNYDAVLKIEHHLELLKLSLLLKNIVKRLKSKKK